MVIPSLKIWFILLLLIGLNATSVLATQLWPETQYKDEVLSLISVLGHDHGEQISSPSEIVVYLKALSRAVPHQTRLIHYATSWEGRPLFLLVISSAENIRRLPQIQSNMLKLSEPKALGSSLVKKILSETLPVSWMSYGVHGDEISSSDAALLVAYQLLAAKNDAAVKSILNNSIVVIDPSQNPDGRARFLQHFRQSSSSIPALNPLAAEHRQVWPGGRFNHYLFDMNRDWFALTQPETRGRIAQYLKFQPVVHADIHEMGVNQSYYFPPPAEPLNPYITETQRANLDLYGQGNVRAFDQHQYDYFSREIFDAYYPGYGDTWPTFHGAVGMTFEMASARGLAQQKSNGKVVTYRAGVYRHSVSSMATLLTTAENKDQLLRQFYEYRNSASRLKTTYVIGGKDRGLVGSLAQLLVDQGIEVNQLNKSTKACDKQFIAGDIVIAAGQGAGRLVRTLLESDSSLPDSFWHNKEQLRRQQRSLALYDTLAWSLPGLYNLKVSQCDKIIKSTSPYSPITSEISFKLARIAYVVEWGSTAAVNLLSEAQRLGLVVRSAGKPLSLSGRRFGMGALIFKVADNDGDLYQTLAALANRHQVDVVSVNSSWTDSGINFGSQEMRTLIAPKIALAWDEPTSSSSAGSARFVIEQQIGYPTTPVRVEDLQYIRIKDFNVLVLPEGGDYKAALGDAGVKNIQSWVSAGGTLITLGNATSLLLAEGMALINTQLESRGEVTEEGASKEGLAAHKIIDSLNDYLEIIAPTQGKPDSVPGVLVRGAVNHGHWLASGLANSLNFMLIGRDIYSPLKLDAGTNVVSYTDADSLLVGGYLWQENLQQLAYKPAVMATEVGQGHVIAFTSDPTFRAYMHGLNVILSNAIFLGPSR